MTSRKNRNPMMAPGRAFIIGSETAYLGGCGSDHSTMLVVINRLRHRCGYSEPLARAVAELAGIGPREVRR